jgi:hypothetical protein
MTFSFNNENLLYKYLSIVQFDICLLLLPQKSDIQENMLKAKHP